MDARLPAITLVTGAASGIGAAVTAALVREGGRVVAIDRDERAPFDHPAISRYRADVRDARALVDIVERAERELGAIDGLVHAAGVLSLGAICDAPDDALRDALAVNVEGLWSISRALAPRMIRRARGAIVTISSNAGSTPRVGMGAYCASKAAATMLTQCLALELAPHGIRCNVVSPGSTDTPMLRRMLDGASPSELVRGRPGAFKLGIPLGRVATPDDVAQVALFLLSERARHVTLQDVRVDGGATF
ncbi:SDR family oxidoreductase [Sandaracinus amylolyticus]|uniref:3-oxoacyl-[acyl-carrier protein] reductase n=1 Tax=Sandaracinus amylolyticus TaxID=927083 RepID=A0A0F6SGH8_9BACT|nr:SDR family oxidoreductase [Sandaracinus amylolyticus]AKF08719.1 3-oxoacyl-[acyl-carrier protein] reductase [Sandaracinus amylolyticus]